MTDSWLNTWNSRYSDPDFAYGTEPNEFLRERLKGLTVGKALFAAEGEGRNAVYAAKRGWEVTAFDISIEGKKKALALAEQNDVTMKYHVGLLPELPIKDHDYDLLVLIYSHFPPGIKSTYHKILDSKLRKGGTIIFEAFGKNHLKYRKENPKVGGPPDYDSLFSVEELKADFTHYKIEILKDEVVTLNEGLYHNGKGSVVRFVARKE